MGIVVEVEGKVGTVMNVIMREGKEIAGEAGGRLGEEFLMEI